MIYNTEYISTTLTPAITSVRSIPILSIGIPTEGNSLKVCCKPVDPLNL